VENRMPAVAGRKGLAAAPRVSHAGGRGGEREKKGKGEGGGRGRRPGWKAASKPFLPRKRERGELKGPPPLSRGLEEKEKKEGGRGEAARGYILPFARAKEEEGKGGKTPSAP